MPITNDINSIKNLFTDTKIDQTNIADLWTSWQFSQELKDKVDSYSEVIVTEEDSWYSISEELYGRRDYWWIIALYNDVEDPFSLFYNNSVSSAFTRLKIPDISSLNIILGTIRDKRIQREVNG